MKKIVEYKHGTRSYAVGDVVYLARKMGKPICRAIAINNDNEVWTFEPLSKQAYYPTSDGVIPFCSKPYIFAKEVETEEDQP